MKKNKRILISLLLVIAMLTLTSSPVLSADVKEEPAAVTEQAGASITSDAVSSDVKEEVVALNVYSLDKSECMIAEYVNTEEFNKASHVKRLNDEEELDTYVFLNSDGTKSVYYMDENVKFVDKNGDVKEKDVSLVKKTDGFGIVRNEFDLHIPNSASSGISMSYNGYDVKLIPQTSVRAVPARQNGDTVVYDGFFGTNTSLVYTPMLSGVKEDVVMKAYIPNAEFRFVLETDGLGLYLGKDGYYLAESETSEAVLSLGNVIIYDAIGKPEYGTMTVTTVTANQKYILSLSAPEEFLTDPTTVYPVTIDPTLTVSDTATCDGAIEDTVLFSGKPTKNYGDYKYLSIGYVDSTYGVGRVAIKLPGLYNSAEYLNTHYSDITSVKFYCRDSSGNSAQYVNLHPITGPLWDENTVTYGDSVTYSTTYNWGTSMSSGTWTTFDITVLVQAWKNIAYAPTRGFILINSNETSASYKKAPYSSEYTGTALRPYVMMTYEPYGIDFDSAASLPLGTPIVVDINSSGLEKYYEFTPSSNGFYTFESFSNNGDPYARLYNSNQEQISYNDNGAGNDNFRMTYHLFAGKAYYFVAGCYSSGTGNYCATLTQTTNSSYVNAVTVNWGDSRTVSCNSATSVSVFKFIPPTSEEYLFYSSNSSGDPKIWLYDSSLTCLISNDDSAGNSNARLTYQLVAGHTYYVVAGQYGLNTGTYNLYLLKASTLSNANYYFRNIGTFKYMDIDGPYAQEWVHQWTAHTGLQEKWTIQKQTDGYYTIRSLYGNKYYVGISTNATGENNIKLYSTISDATKWKIYELNSNQMIIEPKTAVGKILYAPNTSVNTELQLSYMGASLSNRNQWHLLRIGEYFAQVNNYFDNGYSVYYNESNSTSQGFINGYMDKLSTRYYELLGLTLLCDGATYYESPIDICKGTVDSSNIDTLCKHSGIIHTERTNVISSFKNSFSGSNTITNILWSCHLITSTATNGTINHNRSCSSGQAVFMLTRRASSDRELHLTGVLMHELNHQYGAKDHYHELADENDPTSCKFKDICSTCGENPRPSSCIMYQSRIDISNSNVICTECKNDILSHLNEHHSN